MLRQRLIFGTLMVLVFFGAMLLDGWIDGSLSTAQANRQVQGTILCIIIAALIIAGSLEFSALALRVGAKSLLPVVIPCTILVALVPYLCQLWPGLAAYSKYSPAIVLIAVLLCQAKRYGIEGTMVNCGVGLFSIIYLGVLSSFLVDIRLQFGLWSVLMFIFTIKSSDIGAYTAGGLFGKHKFSPRISPAKTWEGMAGAVVFAGFVGSIFACCCGIMTWLYGALFGVVFAFIGQLGDLAESMLKRDGQLKDSSSSVPGFGGVLDIADSVLISAPFAYFFFNAITG